MLGRLAVAAATLLRGKHKPTFAPNVDGGDFVIVINADKVAIGGDKLQQKIAYRHSGYPGGLHKRTIGELIAKAARPRGRKGDRRHAAQQAQSPDRKLHVYAGPTHPHATQKPVPFEIKQVAQ